MGHRLSKIYTRTGDDGMTGLGDGSRVDKDSPRVEAFGELDELNSVLGLLASYPVAEELLREIADVQHDLFDIGGELCIPGRHSITERQVERLEHCLDTLNSSLQPLKDFVLPGGSRAAAVCHLARAVCRRAERRLVTLARQTEVNAATLCYLNRLSDLLFVMARSLNRSAGVGDVLWQQRKNA
jgi:cob(I)alamin adenosyltransferase